MKLQKWLEKEERSNRWFARQFNNPPTTPTSVNRWCEKGATVPRAKFMQQIEKITDGEVTSADFKPSK
mgnify:CR=1 FL=1